MTLQASHDVAAQEWRLEPELRLGLEYDDNARLGSGGDEQTEIDGYILEGSAGIAYLTPRTTLRVTPRVRSRVYDEEIDVDSDDQFLDADWIHETEKGQFSLRGDYSRESVRTAERADADIDEDEPEEIPSDDTGLLFGNERRERVRISPQWRYQFTERMAFDTRFVWTDTAYEETELGPLRDYNDMRLTASLARELSPRTEGYIGVTGRQFESERGGEVDGAGALVGLESNLSETTRLQAEVGVENTDRSEESGSDSNVVGSINIVRSLETVRMLAQYQRNISAGGAGRVTARDAVTFNVRRQFTERSSGAVGLRAFRTNGLGEEAVTFPERDFTQLHAEFSHALSRTVLFEAEYRHARLDRTGTEGRGNSNSIILWLVYRPTPIVTSR